MKIVSCLFLAAIVACACSSNKKTPAADASACIDSAKIDPNGICTMDYTPVCGCDGKTYGNACSAEKNGVLKWEAGECK